LAGLDALKQIRCLVVFGILLKVARPQVAMQALAIIVGLIEFNLLRFGNCPEILDLEMAKALEFRAHVPNMA
jgi:hypothetical protein